MCTRQGVKEINSSQGSLSAFQIDFEFAYSCIFELRFNVGEDFSVMNSVSRDYLSMPSIVVMM